MQATYATRTPASIPTGAGPARPAAEPEPLIVRGRATHQNAQVGWYGSNHQVVRQQGRDAAGQLGYPCDPPCTEAELLAADRARNVNKAERMAERDADYALDLQIKWQAATGVPA